MAKFSMKRGGKEVGPAEVYAPAHTMTGKPIKSVEAGPDNLKEYLSKMNVSVGNSHSNEYPATKTSGIKVRGTGAATKGLMARGPMA